MKVYNSVDKKLIFLRHLLRETSKEVVGEIKANFTKIRQEWVYLH